MGKARVGLLTMFVYTALTAGCAVETGDDDVVEGASSALKVGYEPVCRVRGSGEVATGEIGRGHGRTTDFAASTGRGHWHHVLADGRRFLGVINVVSCGPNSGVLA